MKKLIVAALLAMLSFAQEGTLAGKVFDKTTGEELIGANVYFEGTSLGASSDIDGSYMIKAPAGTYTLVAEYISYASLKIQNVNVESGKTAKMNLELSEDVMTSDVVVVEAKLYDHNVNGLLVKQKNSEKVFDAISSEQIKKTGDSNVSSALKRVTGITVVGGKNVYVRGLGNRYSNVQLNGSTMPSTNPNKKEVPLDIFPSNVLDNILVQKTFTADQPGEFSGGSVQMLTKNFIDDPFFNMSFGTGYNSESTFSSVLDHSGGSLDFLGFDDGDRALPSYLENGQMTANDAKALNAFKTGWDNSSSSLAPNLSFSLGYGNTFQFDKNEEFSIIATLSQSSKSKFRDGLTASLEDANSYRTDFKTQQASQTGRLTAMLNLAYKPSASHTLSLKNLFTNQGERKTKKIDGRYYIQSGFYHQTVYQFVQEQVLSSSLKSESFHKDFYNTKLKAEVSFSSAYRNEPDKRNTFYISPNAHSPRSEWTADLTQSTSGNHRFFSEQSDNNIELKTDVESTFLDDVKTKIGGVYLGKERDFEARKFVFGKINQSSQLSGGIENDSPEDLFVASNFANNLRFYETVAAGNTYIGEQTLLAGYVSNSFKITEELKTELGVRVEHSDQMVDSESLVKETDVLPAVNLTYLVSEQTNIRFAYSHTLARPEFREISRFSFQDFVGGETVYGNPDIERTVIKNIDLRYEFFPKAGELLSGSVFFKDFTNPIERFSRVSQNNEVRYGNVPSAYLVGAEFEFRKQLSEEWNLSGNVSVIKSEVDYAGSTDNAAEIGVEKRPMFGQSPYTINVNVNYSAWENTNVNLAFNTFGKRISQVGNGQIGHDRYEQPFNKLDLNVSYTIADYKFKLSISNILNENVVHKQNGFTVNEYNVGTDIGLSASYTF